MGTRATQERTHLRPLRRGRHDGRGCLNGLSGLIEERGMGSSTVLGQLRLVLVYCGSMPYLWGTLAMEIITALQQKQTIQQSAMLSVIITSCWSRKSLFNIIQYS